MWSQIPVLKPSHGCIPGQNDKKMAGDRIWICWKFDRENVGCLMSSQKLQTSYKRFKYLFGMLRAMCVAKYLFWNPPMGVYPDEIRQENGRHRSKNLAWRRLWSCQKLHRPVINVLNSQTVKTPILKSAHGCKVGGNKKRWRKCTRHLWCTTVPNDSYRF